MGGYNDGHTTSGMDSALQDLAAKLHPTNKQPQQPVMPPQPDVAQPGRKVIPGRPGRGGD